jgi:glycerophosphoryl diester phosphodiesterase
VAVRTRFFDHPPPLAFAHRGGALEGAENSLAAFRAAWDLGYRYFETDAHVTSDGVVVAFHDDALDRVTDRTGVVAELPWSVVAEARIGGGEPIPRLVELLAAFPDAFVNIDAKHDEVVEPLIAAIEEAEAVDRVCVAAFSDARIHRLQAALPGVAASLGPRGVARLVAGRFGRADRLTADCVQVPPSARGVALVTPRFVERSHRLGLQVHVWTIDDADEMHRLLDLGVDGIMTDRTAVLRDVLVARGAWVDPA